MLLAVSRRRYFFFVAILWGLVAQSSSAEAFSAGIRANGGVELSTVSTPKLLDSAGQSLNQNGEIQRIFVYYGADLVVTPALFGKMALSALVGARLASSKTKGDFEDSLSLVYLPVGASFDYVSRSWRGSGFAMFDLGLSSKLTITAPAPAEPLSPKLSSLSRIRVGGFGEFFVSRAFSLFLQTDYAFGSYKNDAGEKGITLVSEGKESVAVLAANTNKLNGFSLAFGAALYFPPPNKDMVLKENKPFQRSRKATKPRDPRLQKVNPKANP